MKQGLTYVARLRVRGGHVEAFVCLGRVIEVGIIEDVTNAVALYGLLLAHQPEV